MLDCCRRIAAAVSFGGSPVDLAVIGWVVASGDVVVVVVVVVGLGKRQ